MWSPLFVSALAIACKPTPEPEPPVGPEPIPFVPATPPAGSESQPPPESSLEVDEGENDRPGPLVPTDWTLCETPPECILVVTTCCDQCNGGQAIAVNTKYVEDTKAMRGRCDQVNCTMKACSTQTNCLHGRCTIVSTKKN
jgi:hypothetical protein